jgi:tetratricopeptide (TPR) repeat protein
MDIHRPSYSSTNTQIASTSIGRHLYGQSVPLTPNPTTLGQPQMSAPPSDDSLSHSARRAIQLKQYTWALKLLTQLILRHPDQATYYNNRGLVKLWAGQPEAALADYARAIQLNPELDQAYNNRANGYASLGLVTQAIDDYETAIDLNPFNVRARINLGVTRRELGDFDKALTCFDEALVFYQLTAVIYAERGRTFHLRGDWNCAIADYHRALNLINASEDKPQHYRLACRIRKWLAELLPHG